jgi:cytochrome c oxidase assembly protein subunit 15
LRSLRFAAIGASVLTYGLIVLGAFVRATDSGLSCPDWPTCYGHWVPLPSDIATVPGIGYTYGQVMAEWAHRLIAGVMLGPLVLVIAVLAFRQRSCDRRLPLIAGALVLLLLSQGAMGGITVLDGNSPWSVALHLGNALLVLATLLLLVERTGSRLSAPLRRGFAMAAACTTVVAWLAMLSAAMTTKMGAALACATWPSCDGLLIPDLGDPLIRIHFTHRVLAAVTALAVLGLLVASRGARSPVRRLATLAALVVAAEVGLGALVIVWQVPLLTAVLHMAVGVLVFVLLTLLTWRSLAVASPNAKEPAHGLALHGA